MADPSSSPLASTSKLSNGKGVRRSIGFVDEPVVFTFSISDEGNAGPAPKLKPFGQPTRSILKLSAPLSPEPTKLPRQNTPLPEDALDNSTFLEYPVSVIIDATSTLQQLIEAYNLLLARIKSSLPIGFGNGVEESNKPLFYPIKRQSQEFTEAIVRDLGRVLVDPRSCLGQSEIPRVCSTPPKAPPGLPSPRNTPTKSPKKGGLTEEQVKYGRDVCLVTQTTLKFLGSVFALPAIYEVFSGDQLSSVLTAALAIPLKESLPTPNSRKTYNFTLSFLQQQRLPAAVLAGAKDRIIFALRRAIAGEFGREGKKGSVGDGLKAIHDFCALHPQIFLPGIVDMLQSILDMLLAPILALRIYAAHALGGIVLGLTSEKNEFDSLFEKISPVVAEFVLGKKPENLLSEDTPIVAALKTAIKCTELVNHAQGPYWGLAVVASLIVLGGPALHTNGYLMYSIHVLIQLGIKPRKKMLRAMTSTLWGPLLWNWRKWNNACIPDEEATDDEVMNWEKARAMFWKTLRMNAQFPTGHAFFASLLQGDEERCTEDGLLLLFHEIGEVVRRGGDATIVMLDLLERLLTEPVHPFPSRDTWEREFNTKLIPRSLFSLSPGMLTCDGNQLIQSVEYTMSELPEVEDVRPLCEAEKMRSGTWLCVKDIWMESFRQLTLEVDELIPAIFLDLWCHIINTRLLSCKDDTDRALAAAQFATVLTEILADKEIDLRVQSVNGSTSTDSTSAAALALKLGLVRHLWIAMSNTISLSSMRHAFTPMFRYIIQHLSELVPADDFDSRALSQYAQLAAQVSMVGSPAVIRKFFSAKVFSNKWTVTHRACAWRSFAKSWKDDGRGSWKGAATLLGIPFEENNYWELSQRDHEAWNELLLYVMEKGDDKGVPVPGVLNEVALNIERLRLPSMTTSLQLADDLLVALNSTLQDTNEFPSILVDLVQEIMCVTYPPEDGIKIVAQWMIRSLQKVIDACPAGMTFTLLEGIQDGVSRWVSDECGVFSDEEYSRDIVPLYQTLLLSVQSIPVSGIVLRTLAPLIVSGIKGTTGPESEAICAFEDFWIIYSSEIQRPRDGWPKEIEFAMSKLHSHRAWPASSDDLSSEYFDAEESHETNRTTPSSFTIDDTDELDVISSSPLHRKSMRRAAEAKAHTVRNEQTDVRVRSLLSALPIVSTPKRQVTKSSPIRPEKPGQSRVTQSPSTPMRKRQSPGRRSFAEYAEDDDEEKENTPTRGSTLGIRKPITDCVLGKRRYSNSAFAPMSKKAKTTTEYALNAVRRIVSVHQKKRRADALSSDDSEADCTAVESEVMTQDSESESESESSSMISTPSKSPKRARIQDINVSCPAKIVKHDDDLPSSSDIESDDDDDNDRSSSPVGPDTPQSNHLPLRLPSIAKGSFGSSPPSDDSITCENSPTRDCATRRLQQSTKTNRIVSLPEKLPMMTYSKVSPRRSVSGTLSSASKTRSHGRA